MSMFEELQAIGVPVGPPRPPLKVLRIAATRRTIASLSVRQLRQDPALHDAVAAYLAGFRHHWPTAYRRLVGALPRHHQRSLLIEPIDPDRYLKLRRIAIENISGAL